MFSVIMPVHNAGPYLADAIASVRAQTFEAWELLIVDDGSTDGSGALAASEAASDPRIRMLRHPDGGRHGAAASRNLALRAATMPQVAFLDADDLYLPGRLAMSARVLAERPGLALHYAAARWLFEASGRTVDEQLGPVAGRLLPGMDVIERVILNHEGAVPGTGVVTMRRDFALEAGGFDERFTLYEDQTLWVRIMAAHDVLVVPELVAIYRQHDASTSARATREGRYGPGRRNPAGRDFLAWMTAELTPHHPPASLRRALAMRAGRFSEDPAVWLKSEARLLAWRIQRKLRQACEVLLHRSRANVRDMPSKQ